MKTQTVTTLTDPASPRLILFFAGWGMDPRPFAGLGREGYDTAVVWDYTDPSPLPDSLLGRYDEICVAAWSFGVPYAARFITANAARLPITRCVAINGTLTPVDDQTGIPAALFHATLEGLTERSLGKFYRRMTGGGASAATFAAAAPQREIGELADELRQVETDGAAPDPGFDAAYISGTDRIIPPDNQRRAWQGRTQITDLGDDSPHMPGFNAILRREMADKRLISDSFGSAGDTYDSEASIQQEAASHLAALWRSAAGHCLPEGDIVEFGTGTGMLTRSIGNDRKMRLYDIAPVGDGIARADAEVMIEQMIADGPTAGVVSASTIQWFNSPERFIARVMRALPPGAVLALSTFGPDTYRELAPFQESRPRYMSGTAMRAIADRLVAEGIAEAAYTVEEGEPKVLRFSSTRDLTAHTRRSGVNATRLSGTAAARALLAASPVTLTYHPVYILMRRAGD